jgi:chromate transporter
MEPTGPDVNETDEKTSLDSPGCEAHRVAWGRFLGDVFICSLGAYGGPEAHLGVFTEQMVVRRKYLDETDLIELVALCSILPGPTSTQTIVSIGYRMGGPLLALLTMLVWALPVLTVMTILSFLYQFLAGRGISADVLRYVGPMAVGFIILAAFRIGRKVVKDTPTALLMVFGAATTYFIRAPWIFPLVLVIGGVVAILMEREADLWNRVRIKPPWRYLIAFALLALGSLALEGITHHRLVHVFENFYRYGYLVFGGGQVVVPVMHSELVQVREYMTNQEFLTGYGLVQGLPGPMFSFAAYAGGLAARDGSAAFQVLGAVLGGIGIFLPGLLLIYFVYPVWENLKQIRAVRVSLRGINAVAGGLIAIAAVILMQASGLEPDNLLVTVATVALLATRKVPAPLIVAAALAAGFLRWA